MLEKCEHVKIPHEQSSKFQYLAAIVVNLLTITHGISSGWASPSILLLTSNNTDTTPLPSGKISDDEASWVASLLCVGGLIGGVIFGFITNKYGRRVPLILITIPTFISWFLIWFAQNVFYLYVARVLNGCVGGAIFAVVPVFLSEIANDRVRGLLGSTLILSCNFGCLLAFVLGNYFDFYMMPKFVISLTALYTVSIFFFPESPSCLIKKNKISEAERSIRFYQNLNEDADYDVVRSEVKKLQSTLQSDSTEKTNDFKLSDATSGVGRNAMMIGIVLAFINQFCGCFAMLQYTATIFEDAGSDMHPNMAAIVVGILQLIGSMAPALLVDRAGRKFLFIVSTIGIATGLIALGVYMMLKTSGYNVESFSWIPIVSFSFVIFIANWAVLTLPFLVISEIMPENLKSFGTSFCMVLLWVSAFAIVKCLPLLITIFKFHGTMFLFASFCLASSIFIISFMPETKGKNYEQIMNSLR